MTAETARKYEALEKQAEKLRFLFTNAGYEPVAPAILQPADIYLNKIGEKLRARAYVFSALDGEELCLRPDLTVPACRLYLERHPDADTVAKYSYNGPAFRFQPQPAEDEQPREFRQAGIENIGMTNKAKAETEVVSLVSDAIKECGLEGFSIRFGDLGLFSALIDALDIPERWRTRLMHHFRDLESFMEQLALLAEDGPQNGGNINTILAKLTGSDMETAQKLVSEYMDNRDITMVGDRNLEEITERLMDQLADIRAEPLSQEKKVLIENYLAICAPPKAAGARIADLANEAGLNLDSHLQEYNKRLDLLAGDGLQLAQSLFSAQFGRNLDYYTGFVFQFEIPDMKGQSGQIAGGGRYDSLIGDIGSGNEAPAVGSAVHTERLLAAIEGTHNE